MSIVEIDNTGTIILEIPHRTSGSGGGGSSSLSVKEIDGSPTVTGVTIIRVSNGALADDGSGQVTITTGGAPSGTAGGDLAGTYPNPTLQQTSGSYALTGKVSPASFSVDQNNYNPTGLSGANVLRLTPTNNVSLTGLAGGYAGRIIFLKNISTTKYITLVSESSSSTASNRFKFTYDYLLSPYGGVLLQYDSTDARWGIVSEAFGLMATDFGGSPVVINGVTTLKFTAGALVDLGNGVAEVDIPTDPIVDTEIFTGQVANIASANFLNTTTGMYVVQAYLVVSSADVTAGVLTLTIGWNDNVAARTDTLTLAMTSTGYATKAFLVLPQGSANVSYAVSHTGIFGTAVYSLYMSIEQKF